MTSEQDRQDGVAIKGHRDLRCHKNKLCTFWSKTPQKEAKNTFKETFHHR